MLSYLVGGVQKTQDFGHSFFNSENSQNNQELDVQAAHCSPVLMDCEAEGIG